MSSNAVVELKGGMYTLMSLRLHSSNIADIDNSLADKVQQAPGFFSQTPVVVDLSEIEGNSEFDPVLLLEKIRGHKLVPVLASVVDKQSPVATAIELPLVETTKRSSSINPAAANRDKSARSAAADTRIDTDKHDAGSGHKPSLVSGGKISGGKVSKNGVSGDDQQDSSKKGEAGSTGAADSNTVDAVSLDSTLDKSLGLGKSVEYVPARPMMVSRPVRSGQQLYARDADLIVMAHVGPGAEIIADNNVHVYGPLRGRALCGVTGNTESRIFCQSLEAELVSVAGNYKVLEEIPEELRGKPAQIWYQEGRINIDPL